MRLLVPRVRLTLLRSPPNIPYPVVQYTLMYGAMLLLSRQARLFKEYVRLPHIICTCIPFKLLSSHQERLVTLALHQKPIQAGSMDDPQLGSLLTPQHGPTLIRFPSNSPFGLGEPSVKCPWGSDGVAWSALPYRLYLLSPLTRD